MTTVITALSNAFPGTATTVSTRLLASLTKGFRRMAAQRQLALLDDRMLRDIGFDRSDLVSGRF